MERQEHEKSGYLQTAPRKLLCRNNKNINTFFVGKKQQKKTMKNNKKKKDFI